MYTKLGYGFPSYLRPRLARRSVDGFKNQRKHKVTGQCGVFLDRKSTVGIMVRDEEQFPILLLIVELFLELGTYNAVAAELTRRIIPDREVNRTGSRKPCTPS